VIRAILFQPDGTLESGGAEILDQPVPEGGALWIDLEGRGKDHERRLLDWGFHPLAVEDVFTLQHQPKFEEYEHDLFVILRGVEVSHDRVDTLKLAAFVSPRRLVTCHRAPLRSVSDVRRKVEEAGRGYVDMMRLFHQICDELIDQFFPVIEEMGQEVDEMEHQLFDHPEQQHLEAILSLRRRLAAVRRVMLPHRQIFHRLGSAQTRHVDDGLAIYFRDVYDNVFRLTEAADHLQDQLSSAKDTYMSALSQRTNEVVKILTIFSALLLPLTFITGIYGMNFRYIPLLDTPWGFFVVLGAMAALALGMLAWLRHKRWL
jgi:magnesium transporter